MRLLLFCASLVFASSLVAAPPTVRVTAGSREIAVTTIGESREWTFDVPADALSAATGVLTIATDKTFVPSDRGGGADRRRLGLRVFGVRVSNSLTAAEMTR